jgi:flagellar hook-associated protein 3 FlgL
MRISTAEMTTMAVNAMLEQQAALATTQSQVSTGIAVQTPSDNPVAAVQIMQLTQQQSEATQYSSNSQSANTRLSTEEQALSDATNGLQSIRSLVVEAGSTTLTDAERQDIVTQIQSEVQQLLGTANTQDANGEYLFSGYSTQTQPFVTNANGTVVYQGDSGTRSIPVSSSLSVADSDAGDAVFNNIPAGNGTFTTAASASNTGDASIDSGSVVTNSQWVPDTYTLSFTSPTTWQVTDSAGTSVANGAYTSGSAISFMGVEVTVTGDPAAGDSFTVAPAGTQSMFTTLQQITTALSAPVNGPADSAQLTTSVANALTQIDQDVNHLSTVSASVGSRLDLLTSTNTTRSNDGVQLATDLSNVQNVDYTSAIANLNQQMVGLQAAQEAYAAVAQLSLFKYL